ncbi:MAG: hypothetical protein PXY39_14655 [archaeon]|nr:hypothetical protein [archaeon]
MDDDIRAQILSDLLQGMDLPSSVEKAILYELIKILAIKFNQSALKDIEEQYGIGDKENRKLRSIKTCPFCRTRLKYSASGAKRVFLKHLKTCTEFEFVASSQEIKAIS